MKTGLFIDQDWRYGVHEALPDTITVGPDSQGNIHGKLFTVDDFVKFYESETNQVGRFAAERKPEPPRAFVADTLKLPPPTGPKEWDEALAPLRALAERRLKAVTAAEQEATSKGFFDAMMTLTQYRAKTDFKLPVEENKRRQAMVQGLSEPFSHAVITVTGRE